MFTGLVERTGMVTSLTGGRLVIDVQPPLAIEKGGSVAVNGVCLTATGDGGGLETDVMDETLRRTALGALTEGARVNLELPLRLGDPVGGHIVQGHVDGVGTVDSLADEGFARVVHVAADAGVLRYVVEKGSIAVDGVSLTVARVDGDGFDVALIPETLRRTSLGAAAPGTTVNLEVDVLAKYVAKLLPATAAPGS